MDRVAQTIHDAFCNDSLTNKTLDALSSLSQQQQQQQRPSPPSPSFACADAAFNTGAASFVGPELLALRVYQRTHNVSLARRIIAAGVSVSVLAQPQLSLTPNVAELLATHGTDMCSAANVPMHCMTRDIVNQRKRQHAVIDDDDDDHYAVTEPPRTPTRPPSVRQQQRHELLDATCLSKARVRCSLVNKNPHFVLLAPNMLQCNGCAAGMLVGNDSTLQQCMYAPVWAEFHWKTFLCNECTVRANAFAVQKQQQQQRMHCLNCFHVHDTVTDYPIRYASAHNPSMPRVIALCAQCRALPHCARQYATIAYEHVECVKERQSKVK